MRFIHTSDWHLGATLNGKSREEEMNAFFSFLRETIEKEKVDTLLIAGDIFDTSSPSSQAENMWFSFLSSLDRSVCTSVVVIAGNHDSPSRLAAPARILEKLDIHIRTSVEGLEPLLLPGKAIILPVPFPRDQEVRRRAEGDDESDTDRRMKKAIASIYSSLIEKARALSSDLPIIAMGHLMAAGSESEGEGNKDLYVGGLGAIDASIFASGPLYTALGHIHKPQTLIHNMRIRYSGSPIPFSFGEAKYGKEIVLVDVHDGECDVTAIPVPLFRPLHTVKGNGEEIREQLLSLVKAGNEGWVSLLLSESAVSQSVRDEAVKITEGTGLEVISVKDTSIARRMAEKDDIVSLSSLMPEDVFSYLVEGKEFSDPVREELLEDFRTVVRRLGEEGV